MHVYYRLFDKKNHPKGFGMQRSYAFKFACRYIKRARIYFTIALVYSYRIFDVKMVESNKICGAIEVYFKAIYITEPRAIREKAPFVTVYLEHFSNV